MSNTQRRMRIWQTNPYCFVCEKIIEDFSLTTLEHIIPKSKGGKSSESNLAVSHKFCNELKGNLKRKEDWKKKWKEHELSLQNSIWKRGRNDEFVKILIKESFFDLEFVGQTLQRFSKYSEIGTDVKNDLKLIKNYILDLRKSSDLEKLIEYSKNIDQFKTKAYWKIIFGLLFIEHYLKSNNVIALLHAIWRLSSFQSKGPSLILYEYSQELLDLCRELDRVAFEKWMQRKPSSKR